MDFARKQLEKYGWSAGKGLGKYENGISEALKPKLKRSVTGIGHDPASEFNEHWWTTLYDKAAGNVQVEEKNGKTKKIKTKDNQEFVITNSTWKLNRKQKKPDEQEQYSDFFVRTAVLSGCGSKFEKLRESESDEEDNKKKTDVFKMTDEELFAACEGRTAHKGARHGLKAVGKLARIAQQESLLLTLPKYNGYSHTKKPKPIVEDMNLNSDSEVIEHKKKKKKRKWCTSNDLNIGTINLSGGNEDSELLDATVQENNQQSDDNDHASDVGKKVIRKKSKKKKRKSTDTIVSEIVSDSIPEKKKKMQPVYFDDTNYTELSNTKIKKKTRKSKE